MVDEGDIDFGDDIDEATLEELQESAVSLDAEGGDEGQLAHDEGITGSLRQEAIQMMASEDVIIDAKTAVEAQSIIPRVCCFFLCLISLIYLFIRLLVLHVACMTTLQLRNLLTRLLTTMRSLVEPLKHLLDVYQHGGTRIWTASLPICFSKMLLCRYLQRDHWVWHHIHSHHSNGNC